MLEERTKAIVSLALVENRASTRVMEKCGLVPDGEVVLPGYEMRGIRYKLLKTA
jgi:RimJ/RimL family protein N-acetyltransferase